MGAKMNEQLKASKLFDVSNYTAVVTGGGSGIGLMITQALVANGAKVYITGRREEALKAVVDQHSKGPGKIISLPGDITSKDDIKRLATEVGEKEPKGIHLLVNNAGIARDDGTKYSDYKPDLKDVESIANHMWRGDPESWQETFMTNITSQFFVAAGFLPLLGKGREATPGFSPSIVNITSISGLTKDSHSGKYAYGVSKAGFIHLTKLMAKTFAEAKIRVNSIAPGIFPSEMTAGDSDAAQKSKLDREIPIPAGRPGNDADMAACILYLAGPGGVFLNGQVIYPDGGNLLVEPAVS